MYLSALKDDEKSKFLELVYKVANYDHSYSPSEIRLIDRYKKELGITNIPVTSTIDDLMKYFSQADDQSKQVVLFEIYGIILADHKLSDKEKEALAKLESALNLPEERVAKILDAAEKLEVAYKEAYKAVF